MSNNASASPAHATVFIWIFALASIWHYASSPEDVVLTWLRYDPFLTPITITAVLSALVAAVFPDRTWATLVFAGGQLVTIFLRFPFVADHLVMELFLHLAIVLSFVYLAISKRSMQVSTTEMFELFSPIGRWLLIVMYFYGTFHKFNPGFMTPDSSCAIPFANGLPLASLVMGQAWAQYAAMYSVLLFEAIAMLLLFSSRGKYWGMLLGMTFHFIIGISSYGTMAHFSAFALALHTLFLPSGFGARAVGDRFMPEAIKDPFTARVLTALLVVLQVLLALHMGFTRQGLYINLLFSTFALLLILVVLRHGAMQPIDAPYRLRPQPAWMGVLPVWYFVYCFSPYVGLGTGGVLAMFSGLRTEAGISNHYIIRERIPLFDYQDKVIYVEAATNQSLQNAGNDGQGIVAFDFQRHFMQREQLLLPLRLRVDDVVYDITDIESFQAFATEHFEAQTWLERKYMSFRLVDEPKPNRCRH